MQKRLGDIFGHVILVLCVINIFFYCEKKDSALGVLIGSQEAKLIVVNDFFQK
jgi:hypothetical protein